MSEWQYQPECRCHYCTQIRSAGTLAGAAQGMNVDHDPAKSLLKPLPPSEKAELQVSLLNEIGLTLTAVAKQAKADGVIAGQRYGALLDWSEANGKGLSNLFELMAEQAETLKTYKLSLEGIQGLLVDLTHSLDVIAEVQANSYDAVVTKFTHIEKRLAQIEEAIQCKCEMIAKFRGGYATDPSKCSIHGYPTLPERPVTVKRKPSLRPVSRKKRKR